MGRQTWWRDIPFDDLAPCHAKHHDYDKHKKNRDREIWEKILRGKPAFITTHPQGDMKCPQGHPMYAVTQCFDGLTRYACEGYLDFNRMIDTIELKTDMVVEAVRADLLQRSQFGIKKYGVTLERDDLSLEDWLQHAYTECLDQANYLKRSIMKIRGELP